MNVTNHLSRRGAASTRCLLRKPLILAASLALSAFALPASAGWWSATPPTTIGSAKVNVRNMGALGNGRHNDTSAFQAAINSLPSTGGTVTVPAGKYMIDALHPIKMRSHTRLLMASGAELDVIPNSAGRYHVIKVWNVNNVRIVGGSLVGDRAAHRGTTGEWGYGINIEGSKNIVVKGVHVSDFWGDGVLVGGTGWGDRLVRSDGVTLNGVVSTNNRRQGLTIGPAQHVYVVNSTFSNSNGTAPQAGIDIEPQTQGPANAIRIENTVLSGNRGNGLELQANISDISLVRSTMKDNHGFGALSVAGTQLHFANNTFTRNGLAGVRMSGKTNNSTVTNNSLTSNSTIYMSPTRLGGGTSRDLQITSTTWAISTSGNTLSPKK